MKKRSLSLILGLVLLISVATFGGSQPPPPPPPETYGVEMTCLNVATGAIEDFKGTWDGTQRPWLYTFLRVYYRMEADGTGWKPVPDRSEYVVVNIKLHKVVSIKVPTP